MTTTRTVEPDHEPVTLYPTYKRFVILKSYVSQVDGTRNYVDTQSTDTLPFAKQWISWRTHPGRYAILDTETGEYEIVLHTPEVIR